VIDALDAPTGNPYAGTPEGKKTALRGQRLVLLRGVWPENSIRLNRDEIHSLAGG
jgi:hypothetical protein